MMDAVRLRRAGEREREIALGTQKLELKGCTTCCRPQGEWGIAGPGAGMGERTKRRKRQINGDLWLGAGSVTASALQRQQHPACCILQLWALRLNAPTVTLLPSPAKAVGTQRPEGQAG